MKKNNNYDNNNNINEILNTNYESTKENIEELLTLFEKKRNINNEIKIDIPNIEIKNMKNNIIELNELITELEDMSTEKLKYLTINKEDTIKQYIDIIYEKKKNIIEEKEKLKSITHSIEKEKERLNKEDEFRKLKNKKLKDINNQDGGSILNSDLAKQNIISQVLQLISNDGQPIKPVPAINQPPVPAINQPPVPAINKPPVPAINKPPVPAINKPPVPAINKPPVPAINKPPVPAINKPPVPAINQPPVPAINKPIKPFPVVQPVVKKLIKPFPDMEKNNMEKNNMEKNNMEKINMELIDNKKEIKNDNITEYLLSDCNIIRGDIVNNRIKKSNFGYLSSKCDKIIENIL